MQIDLDTLKQIIREEILRALSEPESCSTKCDCNCQNSIGGGLLICNDKNQIHPQIIERLNALTANKIHLKYICNEDFLNCGGLTQIQQECNLRECTKGYALNNFDKFCQKYQFVLLPCVSIDLAVKTVWGLTDTNTSKVLFECLRRRFPVIFIQPPNSDSKDTIWNDDIDLSWPLWIRDNMHQIWRTFLEWGIQEVSTQNLNEHIIDIIKNPPPEMAWRINGKFEQPKAVRIYITAGDIEAIWKTGEKEISVPPNAVLTPEAEELTQKLNIKIQQTFPKE